MKIVLDLPDWVEGRHLRIFAGIEELAKKYKDKPWKIKIVRCDMCGKCCMNVVDDWKYGKDEKTGWCANLIYYANEYRCNALAGRPFSCCTGDCEGEDYCCIKWKEIDETVTD